MSLTEPFFGGGILFFEGSLVALEPIPLTVNLDGIDYPIDLTQYRRNGLEALREGVVTSGEPDDQLFDSRGSWWRYRSNWVGGAGQRLVDIGDRQQADRFYASRGLDVWEETRACLHHSVEDVRSVASANAGMLVAGDFVYYWSGTTVFRSSDLSTWNEITGLAGTVNGLATDGTDVYVATGTNLYTVAPAGLAAAASTSATAPGGGYSSVAFVANRLMATGANVLYEVGASTLDAVYTHFQPAFRWTTIFAIGSRIYVGGFAGSRSELLTLQTLSDGNLAPGPEAAPLGPGELLRTGLSYGGAALLGTSLGIRFAQVAGDGNLEYGPLIDAPGDVRAIDAQGRYAWFTWANFPDGGAGVGRLDLANQVDLQPAYATDVYTEATTGTITGVGRFNNRTLFLVANNAIYAESTTDYVTEGFIESGEVYFGTIERKAVTEIQIRFLPLVADQRVTVSVMDDQGTELGSGTVATVGARGLSVDLDGKTANYVTIRIEVEGDGTEPVCLTTWRARAYPIAPAVEQWIVPLIISSQVIVNDGMGEIQPFDVLAEVERLARRWRDKKVIGYREGPRTYRVRIDNYEMQTKDWRDSHDFFEVIMLVRLYSV